MIGFAEESVCSLLSTEAQPCKEKKIKRRKSQESKPTDKVLRKKNQVSVCVKIKNRSGAFLCCVVRKTWKQSFFQLTLDEDY